MRFKNFTLLLGAFFMLAASSQAANVALGKKGVKPKLRCIC